MEEGPGMVVWPLRLGKGSTGSTPLARNRQPPCVHPAPLPLPHRGGGVSGAPSSGRFAAAFSREGRREARALSTGFPVKAGIHDPAQALAPHGPRPAPGTRKWGDRVKSTHTPRATPILLTSPSRGRARGTSLMRRRGVVERDQAEGSQASAPGVRWFARPPVRGRLLNRSVRPAAGGDQALWDKGVNSSARPGPAE